MKQTPFFRAILASCIAFCACSASATTWYVNDASTELDVYCSAAGNAANTGTSSNAPALSVNGIVSSLQPGDTVYIDTGVYTQQLAVPVSGTGEEPIVFQGSPNGSTVNVFPGFNLGTLHVTGNYLVFRDLIVVNPYTTLNLARGIHVSGTSCSFSNICVFISSQYAICVEGTSNRFLNCVLSGSCEHAIHVTRSGNTFTRCTVTGTSGNGIFATSGAIVSLDHCIISVGGSVFASGSAYPDSVNRGLFYGGTGFHADQNLFSVAEAEKDSASFTDNLDSPAMVEFVDSFCHLPSPAGHVVTTTNAAGLVVSREWVTNATVALSLAVDAGDVTADIGMEPSPNGGRLNLGAYAGTAEASKSPAGASLSLASFNGRANLIGSGTLRWIARNVSGNVTVDYSTDNGIDGSWTTLDTIAATNEAYEFTTLPAWVSPSARWRVSSTSDHQLAATSATPFAVRSSTADAFTYYVNDEVDASDIWCTAAGDDGNDGISGATPKASVQGVLDAYALRGGDVVNIDGGTYSLDKSIVFQDSLRGEPDRPLRFVGASPDLVRFIPGGTRNMTAFLFKNTVFVSLENVLVTNVVTPAWFSGSRANIVSACAFYPTSWGNAERSVRGSDAASGNIVKRCLFFGGYAGIEAGNNIFLNNVFVGQKVHVNGSGMFLTNNIFTGGGTAFNNTDNACDYNLFDTDVAVCSVAGYTTLEALKGIGKGWSNSFVAAPGFVDAANGDYHLRSTNGYYSVAEGGWVTNGTVHSPAIDRGLPDMDVADEPHPNGGRINIGRYGGTVQASKSATGPWLQVLSLTDGGTFEAASAGSVSWTGGNLPDGATVAILLSRDDGASWEPVASGIAAAAGVWNYAAGDWPTGSAWTARWKIVLESDPAVESTSTKPFVYRYGAFTYYVNDASTEGDVYCDAAGDDANAGVSPSAPKASLAAVLSTYTLSAGDVVKVDTGTYPAPASSSVYATLANVAGEEGNPVKIVGSTNAAAGGAVLGQRLVVRGSTGVEISHLTLTNAIGLDIADSSSVTVHDVFFRRNATYGMRVAESCDGIDIAHVSALSPATALYVNLSTNVLLSHASVHGATASAVVLTNRGSLAVANSAFSVFDDNASVYSVAAGTTFASDYNGIHSEINAFVGTYEGQSCESLASWGVASGQDVHSLGGAPRFANPENGDFHLCTTRTRGRFLPDGTRTADTVRSPLLAAGNPASDASSQAEPSRVNIGRYGGTAEASLPPETPWLQVATFLDAGGVPAAGEVPLRWISGGGASGEAVVSVSTDGGFEWNEVARAADVTAGKAVWTVSEVDPDSPACRWRVALAADGAVSSDTEKFFSIRKSPLVLYLNNYDTNDTVFTSAAGAATNYRATASAPLDSLARAFELYDLEGGDTLQLDRGVYTESADIRLTRKNTGTDAGHPVLVIGLPSDRFSGAVLARSSRTRGYNGVSFSAAGPVRFENLAFSNNYNGVVADACASAVFRFVRFSHSAANGVLARSGSDLALSNCIVASSAYGLFVTGGVARAENCLFRSNATAAVLVDRPRTGASGSFSVKNSILSGGGASVAYMVGSSDALALLASDYNDVVMDKGTPMGRMGTTSYRYLYDWQQATALDAHTVGFQPLFADEEAGDFHLQSAFGRYDGGEWPEDGTTSPLVDLADPAVGVGGEPSPNGARRNIGLYGGSEEASKSAGDQVRNVTPLTMSDGGVARGSVTLYWDYNGFIGNETCFLEASFDGGATWIRISPDLYLNRDGGYEWDVSALPSTAQALWRISVLSGGTVVASGTTETVFSIKNEPLVYYVNDASRNGDVYCSSSGNAANDGLSSETPLDSIETVFKNYQIDAGDTVYVDTGTYVLSDTLAISQGDASATNYLSIRGSTNFAAGGSVLTNAISSNTVVDVSGSLVDFRNFRLLGGPCGFHLTEANSNRIASVTSIGADRVAFEIGKNSGFNEFVNCAALDFGYTGLVQNAATAPTDTPQTNTWINGVFANAERERAIFPVAHVGVGDGLLRVTNSVFVARAAPNVHFFNAPAATLASDYNCFDRNGFPLAAIPLPGVAYGVRTRYAGNLEEWRTLSGNDRNSFEADPLFTDLAACNLLPRTNSPLIDTGDPSLAAWRNEPTPNGGRVNLGVFGGTPFAQTTPTGFGYTVLLSCADGGTASGAVPLRWTSVGVASNADYTLTAQVSADGGLTWLDQGTVAGPSGEVTWDSTALRTSPCWHWRVSSDRPDLIPVSTSGEFVLHNNPIDYYVNDSSTEGDVFCSRAGASAYDGLSPDTPLDSVANVLSRYDLAAGDIIHVDTGIYENSSPIYISPFDGGTMDSPVCISGSTNSAAGGTVFTGCGLSATSLEGFALSDVIFASHSLKTGFLQFHDSQGISLDRVDVQGSLGDGIIFNVASNVYLRNVSVSRATSNGVVAAATTDAHILRSTIWSNALGAVEMKREQLQGSSPLQTNTTLSVRSSILGSAGMRVPVFQNAGTKLESDYNAISTADGALVGLVSASPLDLEYDSLVRWNAATSNDLHTLSQDPLFASVRDYDFHLQSAAGRWSAEGIRHDPETSPLLDAGDPSDTAYANELSPHGGRINVGRFAGTCEGSATPDASRLTLISLNDGGSISGTNTICWLASGAAAEGPVTLSYSTDGGATWNGIATLPAGTTEYAWDVSGIQSVATLLRLESSDGTMAQSETTFAIRSRPYAFYVNDDSRVGDVYCSAVGSVTNTGLATNSPLRDLNDLLARYDLEAGDVVYIDTGLYENPPSKPWVISQQDSAYGAWERDGDVVFQGSTNRAAGGTVIGAGGGETALRLEYVQGVTLRHLVLSNATSTNAATAAALSASNALHCAFEWLEARNSSYGYGFYGCSNIVLRHSVARLVDVGAYVNAYNASISNCVFWMPAMGPTLSVGGRYAVSLSDSVLTATNGAYLFSLSEYATLESDYNAYQLCDAARVCRITHASTNSPVPTLYETVAQWTAATNRDVHSYAGTDLGFADAAGGDFHLLSTAGRPTGNGWTNDAASSPLIDMGNPLADASAEPGGGRADIGLYGGTAEASRTPTDDGLTLLSFNRGGIASNRVVFAWIPLGCVTSHTVKVELSCDGGETWDVLARGINATEGELAWNSGTLASPLCYWRVTDESNSSVSATNALPFTLHNRGISYYVNDDDTADDVYCRAAGSPGADGLSPESPVLSLRTIVDTYDLEPGDTVYVDSGYYYLEQPIEIGDLDCGTISTARMSQVVFQGSTNQVGEGTLFWHGNTNEASILVTSNAVGLRFSDLHFSSGSAAVAARTTYFANFDWLDVEGAVDGLAFSGGSDVYVTHSQFRNCSHAGVYFNSTRDAKLQQHATVDVESSVFWNNRFGVYLQNGYLGMTHSVMGLLEDDQIGYLRRSDGSGSGFAGDYNDFFVATNTAFAASVLQGQEDRSSTRSTTYASVSRLQEFFGSDAHSLSHDPLFANPDQGDFHLRSAAGRWETGTWTRDGESSPLIDSGNPADIAWAVEPAPNGRRRNIGRYGGSPWASRSDAAGTLVVSALNDGGSVSGEVLLTWIARGDITNSAVVLEYSPDDGITWSEIASGIPATDGSCTWDSTPYGSSALSRWRVHGEAPYESVSATCESVFTLRNAGSIVYYVNNGYDEGRDVWCTAPGNDRNDGLTPATPKASIESVLETYDLDPEDEIRIDAGTYPVGSPAIEWTQADAGYTNAAGDKFFVTLRGSTNPVAPTVLAARAARSPVLFSIAYAGCVRFRDLVFSNGLVAVSGNYADNVEFERVRFETPADCALSLSYSEGWRMENCIIHLPATNAVNLANSALDIDSSVLWCSANVFGLGTGPTLSVSNSVLRASGASSRIYPASYNVTLTNAVRADYNDYVRDNGAILVEQGRQSGGSLTYDTVGTWNAASGQDAHSMVLDPLFADVPAGDFHPQSAAGRFLIATNEDTGTLEAVWTNDFAGVRSPLIDAGATGAAWAGEPTPNGGIRNIGAYGNTDQASKSMETPWIQAISYNSGETIAGTVILYWTYGGTNDNTLVEIAYSEDGGLWHEAMATLPISAREYRWDTTAIRMLPHVKWRVRTVDQTLADVSDAFSPIRNGTSKFYVNDASLEGDLWCTNAVGAEFGTTNALGIVVSGTNALCPLRSLQEVLDNYPVGAGDTVYVDTGTYTDPAVFTIDNAGNASAPLTVCGSTNGTRLAIASRSANAISFVNTANIALSDVEVVGGLNAWYLENASDIVLSRVSAVSAASNGVLALNAANFSLRNALVVSNRAAGYRTGNNLGGSRSIDFATFAANGNGIVNAGNGGLDVSNSVLVATNGVLYTYPAQNASITGDYNLYALSGSAALAYDSSSRATYTDLSQWAAKAGEGHSVVLGDPLCADAANGDYHLASQAGSWHGGTWAVDVATSWGIDFADPEAASGNNRANAGAYGGTERESKSFVASPSLQVLTFADGGTSSKEVTLRWASRGIAPSSQVRISHFNGSEWIVLGTTTAGADGFHWWASDDPSPESRWKVELVSNPDICSESATFSYRPKPISYYVNDASTAGDVYCSAPGASDNLGYRTNSPLDSVQAVLDRFTLVGGDVIYVDTGDYLLDAPIEWTSVDSGDGENGWVALAGSTNAVAGGTLFRELDGMRVASAFVFPYATHHVRLKQFSCEGFDTAVTSGQSCQALSFEDLRFLAPRGAALANNQGNDFTFSRVVVSHAGTNGISLAQASRTAISNCVFYLVASNALSVSQSSQTAVTNCIFAVSGEGAACYQMSEAGDLVQADYNDLYLLENAVVGVLSGVQYESVPQWVKFTAQDLHSLNADPLFANPEKGDFHLKSATGRYDPETGDWPTDDAHSPCIDTGLTNAPSADAEPVPNGGRINMGAFGGTAQASKSQTEDWVQAVSAMGGGIMAGTITLVWNYGGNYLDPAGVATLEYSPDNGQNWTLIANTTLSNGLYRWVSTQTTGGNPKWPSSPGAMWRITSGGASNPTAYFGLRNEPFKYYVNDDSLAGDLWCTNAVGSDENLGYWPSAPKRTLENLLASIDAEPGDGIYVDTGIYPMETNIVWNPSDGGENGLFVHAYGSSNGVWFTSVTSRTFQVDANYTDISGLNFEGPPGNSYAINLSFTGTGLAVSNCELHNASLAVSGNEGTFDAFRLDRRSATLAGTNNLLRGLHLASGTATLSGSGNTLQNSVIHTVGNSATGLLVRAASAVVTNCTIESERGSAIAFANPAGAFHLGGSILVAGGTGDDNAVLVWESGALASDWNDLVARNGAWVGIHDGDKWERLAYWQSASGVDAHSIALEPLFVADGADFHLDSTTGWWDEGTGGFVPGFANSPCIDAGDPATPYEREILPNGSRINLGAYANTPFASKSSRDRYVVAVSPSDGGAVTGAVRLVWAAPYGHDGTVSLFYRDGGGDWNEIVSGIPAGDKAYTWDATGLNLFSTLWKVVDSEGNESVAETVFDVRNVPQDFFVNDDKVEIPGYCTVAGDDANDGLTPGTPKATLSALLAAYDLEPGDTVYVDKGRYPLSATTRLVWSSGGDATNAVRIVGYPTEKATMFTRASGAPAFAALDLKPDYVVVSNLFFHGIDCAILCDRTFSTLADSIFVRQCGTGVEALSSENVAVSHCGFWNCDRAISFSNTVDAAAVNNTFVARDVAPAGVAIDLQGTTEQGLTLKNNIFELHGYAYAYGIHGEPDQLSGGMALVDYNLYDFVPENEISPSYYHGTAVQYPALMDWQLAMDNDFRSATNAADLAETEAGYSLDFHPLSQFGRWTASGFVNDSRTSFAVDHGDIYQDVGDEPEENSGRINIGMYGGTAQASKGSGEAYYETRSLSGGEGETIPLTMGRTYVLVWASEGFESNKLVTVEFFNGTAWVPLADSVPAWQEYIRFTPDQTYMTANGRWRVSSVDNPEAERATSGGDLSLRFGDLQILTAPKMVNGRMRFTWQGGIGGKEYWILYSDDGARTWHKWNDSENGPAFLNRNHFTLTTTQKSYVFEDRTSYRSPHRLYGIVETEIGEGIGEATKERLHIVE